jgi:site-specific recombinase XerD
VLGEWRAWAAGRGLLPTSIETYERVLRRLQADRGAPEGLDEETIGAWLASLGGAPTTQNKRLAALRTYYEFLIRIKRRQDDPTAPWTDIPSRRGELGRSPSSRRA